MTTILHLLSNPSHIDRLLGRQIEATRARGYTVVTASAPGERSKAQAAEPFAHHSLAAISIDGDVVADVRASAHLRSLFAEVQPDIVHAHDTKMSLAARVFARREGVPIIVNSTHSHPVSDARSLARRVALARLGRLAAEPSDAELVYDAAAADVLRSRGVRPERIHVVGHGIDLDAYTPSRAAARAARCLRLQLEIPQRTKVVTVLGDLAWDEGYASFFEAVQIVRSSMRPQPIAFVVAGRRLTGLGVVDSTSLDRVAADLDVRFLDGDIDHRTVLSMSDVCVIPTAEPTLAGAAMQAGAMGVPTVAIDSPDIRSVVDHQQTGLLVRPGKPQHLALTIERLLSTQSLCDDLGRAGRAKAVKQFDDRRVLDRTIGVYEEQLVEKGREAPEHIIDLAEPWYADSIDLVDRSDVGRSASVSDRPSIS